MGKDARSKDEVKKHVAGQFKTAAEAKCWLLGAHAAINAMMTIDRRCYDDLAKQFIKIHEDIAREIKE